MLIPLAVFRHPRAVLLAAAAVAWLVLNGPAPSAARANRVTKPFSFAVLEDYDKGDDLGRVAEDFAIIRDLGTDTWRGRFGWDDYEPERGRYDLAWLHAFARKAAESGITLRPYLGYTAEWAAAGGSDEQTWNDPPRDPADWAAFVRVITGELAHHPNVASIEIYNEENVRQGWDGTAAQYARVLRDAATAIRTIAPRLQVLLGGLIFQDLPWVERICRDERTRSFDVLPLHAYPETWTPPEVTVERYLGAAFTNGFVPMADQACGRKSIWINETGFATVPGRSESDQARWWIRAVGTFAAEPRVEHIGVYEIRDPPLDRPVIGDAPNYHLGLIARDGHRKMAYGTVRRLISLLGKGPLTVLDPELRARVRYGSRGELHWHVFQRTDGGVIVMVWVHRVPTTVTLQMPRTARGAIEYGVDGRVVGRYPVRNRELQSVYLTPGVPRVFELPPEGKASVRSAVR